MKKILLIASMAILLCACNRNEIYEDQNEPATRSASDIFQGTMINQDMLLYSMITDGDGNLHGFLSNYPVPVKYTKSTGKWNYSNKRYFPIVYGNQITGLALKSSGNYLIIYDCNRLIEMDPDFQLVNDYTSRFPADMYFVGIATAANGNVFVSMSETPYETPPFTVSDPITWNPGDVLEPVPDPEPVYHTIFRMGTNLNVVQIADQIEAGYTNSRAITITCPPLFKPANGYLYGVRLDGGYYRVGTTGTQLGQATYHAPGCMVLSYGVAANNNWIYMLTMEIASIPGGKQTQPGFRIMEVRPNGVENIVGNLVNYSTTHNGYDLTPIGWPAYETFNIAFNFAVNADATEFYALNNTYGYLLPVTMSDGDTQSASGQRLIDIGVYPEPEPTFHVNRVVHLTF